MLGDNFASYFTEVTDDSLSISPLFFSIISTSQLDNDDYSL